MYKRKIEKYLLSVSAKYRAITLIGPRQSGKTTLARKFFKSFEYYNFENPDIRDAALYDPLRFLTAVKSSVILDEIQRVPEIISYLQEILDDDTDWRQFILTGSNNLKISEKISQSLAGRTRILEVLPFARSEFPAEIRFDDIDNTLFYGGYPRIYKEQLDPTTWLSDYLVTYVEKDIRNVINIENLRAFDNFLRLIAGRVGQLVNYSSLANDAGITHPTAQKWLSALETSYICFILQPHFKNFNKRITKSPKVYFYDSGLLCYLLRINNVEQLKVHPLRGLIFENWVISEHLKFYANQGRDAPLYFWRDQHGHEVDLVIDKGTHLELIEIKSGMTFNPSYFKNINWLNKLQGRDNGICIYGGEKVIDLGCRKVVPWDKELLTD
ncbi:MAG: ATP-binding protein [Pseudomonadota bacterium]|nr:ATP-binding protein [Pseudomonadota bacterium]